MEASTPHLPPTSEPRPPLSPKLVALLAVVLGLVLFITVGAFTQFINAAFGIWFTEVFIFFALAWVLLRLAGHEPLRYTGLAHGAPLQSLYGFALSLANFFALVVPIQFTIQSLVPKWLQEMFDSSRLFEDQTPLEMVVIVAGVSIAAPVCEEFFFRGLLQRSLLPPVLTRMGAVVATAAIFSAFHLDPVGFLARMELGVLFGVLLLRTGSLWPSIFAHSANNLVSTVLFLYAQESGMRAAAEANADADPRGVLVLATLGGIGLWTLLTLGQRIPELSGPVAVEEPAPAPLLPPPSLARLLLPWVVGGTLSLAALVAVDSRGIRLTWFDTKHPLPTLPKKAPAALQAERTALRELRAKARKGEVPLEAYQEERIRQEKALPPMLEKLTAPTLSAPRPDAGEAVDAGTPSGDAGTTGSGSE